MLKQNLINRAIIEASKSEFKQRVGCIIFKGNRIISTGYNIKRYSWRLPSKYKKWLDSLHAEQKAIIYTEKVIKRASILVVRLSANDELVLSKPCQMCMGLILDSHIKNIYYSNNKGQIECIGDHNAGY